MLLVNPFEDDHTPMFDLPPEVEALQPLLGRCGPISSVEVSEDDVLHVAVGGETGLLLTVPADSNELRRHEDEALVFWSVNYVRDNKELSVQVQRQGQYLGVAVEREKPAL